MVPLAAMESTTVGPLLKERYQEARPKGIEAVPAIPGTEAAALLETVRRVSRIRQILAAHHNIKRKYVENKFIQITATGLK